MCWTGPRLHSSRNVGQPTSKVVPIIARQFTAALWGKPVCLLASHSRTYTRPTTLFTVHTRQGASQQTGSKSAGPCLWWPQNSCLRPHSVQTAAWHKSTRVCFLSSLTVETSAWLEKLRLNYEPQIITSEPQNKQTEGQSELPKYDNNGNVRVEFCLLIYAAKRWQNCTFVCWFMLQTAEGTVLLFADLCCKTLTELYFFVLIYVANRWRNCTFVCWFMLQSADRTVLLFADLCCKPLKELYFCVLIYVANRWRNCTFVCWFMSDGSFFFF